MGGGYASHPALSGRSRNPRRRGAASLNDHSCIEQHFALPNVGEAGGQHQAAPGAPAADLGRGCRHRPPVQRWGVA